MEYITQADRAFIEGKYHKDDGTFNPYNRFASLGHECDEKTGLANGEISVLLETLSKETASLPHALAKAKAFALILDNIRIEVNEHDYFVCTHAYSRLMHKLFVGRWYGELLADAETDRLINDYAFSGTSSVWLDTEHFVPDWEYIMENGVPGIIEKAKRNRKIKESLAPLTEKQAAFFDSIIIEYEAVLRLINRLYEYSAVHPNSKSGVVTEALENLSKGAPTNTFEALQLMYIYFICSEGVDQFQVRSLGNGLDRTLYSFYQNDLKTGRFTRDRIKTFLAYFLLQFPAIGHPQGHPFYIGGTNPDGTTRVNDLTYDILEVYDSLNIYNPKIQVKINTNTPPEFIERVLEIIRGGNSSFVFVCQPGMVKALMGMYGTTYEEALDADISGCNEMHVRGNEGCMISALPNAAKAVIYTVFNGMDSFTEKRLGLETGDFSSFKSFDEVYEAFLKQLAYIIDNVIEVSLKREKFVGEINPSVMISGTVTRSMDKMEDAYAFGVKYPTSAI
ncbi:MAG: pyruvate formate lyase family protein, partial [Clostridia bacterium]|nr:pyruvate formate lyase family protein [Clostridia bacterium]